MAIACRSFATAFRGVRSAADLLASGYTTWGTRPPINCVVAIIEAVLSSRIS